MPPKFLLIGHRDETLWFHNLANALTILGELQVLPVNEAMLDIVQHKHDIVIVDKAFVKKEMLSIVSIIHAKNPDIRIIAITSAPTWRQIREVLKAGAMDYISKSLNEREYLSIFKDVLDKHPPALYQ